MSGNVDIGLPDRLSARLGDRHFDKKAEGLSDRVDVYLNGALLGEVTSWDVRRGEITRLLRNQHGKLMLDEAGKPTFELLQGKVEVRWISKGEPAA